MKKILILTLSLVFLLTLFSLNVFAQEPVNYVIVEVTDVYVGNSSLIDELELFDENGEMINYTTSDTQVYDTKSTNGIPGYWNTTGWGRDNLNDGEKLGVSGSAVIVNYITSPGAGNWTRFVVTLPENSTISKINVWTNKDRIPQKISLYSANSYDFNLNIKGKDNTGLTLIREIIPAPTATGSTNNEVIIDEPAAPSAPANLTATAGIEKVDLQWDAVLDATGYNVKRAEVAGGPYNTVASNITNTNYTDNEVEIDITYYYVVTAITADGESGTSNEASVTPTAPVATGNNAILELTMINGTIKEYDLDADELQDFLDWYDTRSEGDGKAYFVITKKFNINPFLNRTEYIPFDKIFSFEVKEY